MNQVTEMLRLAPGASVEAAVSRLSGLFAMMQEEPGFREAELLHRLDDPAMLLVLHAWDRLQDWQAFQTSQRKLDFSAGRPSSLYTFVPCGMNWRLESGALDAVDGALLRREVSRTALQPCVGPEVLASAVHSFAGPEPDYSGASLRLTRLTRAPAVCEDPPAGSPADELYESLHRAASAGTRSTPAAARL